MLVFLLHLSLNPFRQRFVNIVSLLQEGGPLPGPETGLLSKTQK